MIRAFAVVCFVTLVLGLTACTTSGPEIIELFWQINHRYDVAGQRSYEELAFFVHGNDADGEDDFESIYLLSDSAELFWHLQADSWERPDIPDETWIGHSGMQMYRGESFPRGQYRVILADRAGERAESTIFLSAEIGSPQETEYPVVVISDGTVRINSTYARHTIRFYDGADDLVSLVSTDSKVVPLRGVLSPAELERVTEVSVYAYDDTRGIGVISGDYPVE